jgi:hypothetical protein
MDVSQGGMLSGFLLSMLQTYAEHAHANSGEGMPPWRTHVAERCVLCG